MASRDTLKQYCLRALGAPMVEINIAPEQLEDRIDEALQYFTQYHYEGVEKFYMTHLVTASTLDITTPTGASFASDTTIIGGTSGATALVQKNVSTTQIRIRNVKGEFIQGETVSNSLVSATLSSAPTFYTAGDTENRYIPIPDAVWGVVRIFPIRQQSSSQGLFDIQYQLMLNDIRNLTSTDIVYFTQAMSHLSLLEFELSPAADFEFNRLKNQLRIDIDWKNKVKVDSYICVEAYRALNPNQFTKVYDEPWLKHYVTSLFKKQWGTNLKKFGGIALPGGVVLDGNIMYQEAKIEQVELEQDLMSKSAPLSWFVG